jgi:hypothetical protein
LFASAHGGNQNDEPTFQFFLIRKRKMGEAFDRAVLFNANSETIFDNK